jgi:hypothetical protein
MRMIFALMLLSLSLSSSTFSAEVTCFSGKTRIYHGYGYDFTYNEDYLAFMEYKSKHLIIISGDCIIIAPIYQENKLHATGVRKESQK